MILDIVMEVSLKNKLEFQNEFKFKAFIVVIDFEITIKML